MKKKMLVIVIIAASLFSGLSLNAQSVKGQNFVNAGVGIGTFGLNGTGGLPITVSYERGVTDKISAGLYAGFISRKWYDDIKYRYKVIGVRGSYHFNELLNISNPKLDVYGGASIYYRGYTVKYEAPEIGEQKITASTISVALHAGGRYMFSKNAGAFAELGYGVSPLQLGLSLVF